MKYFIYTRKSTGSGERQVMSLESQFSELKEFATEEKFEIVLFASASGRGGRKGIWGNSARRANRAQNQFAFFQIHTADWERIEELEL